MCSDRHSSRHSRAIWASTRAAGALWVAVLATSGAYSACAAAADAPEVYVTAPLSLLLRDELSVPERVQVLRDGVERRLEPYFDAAGVDYPPRAVVLLGLKHESRLEVYAGPSFRDLRFVRDYAVMAQSGVRGPKLREGDRQVPEGIYSVAALNPNSRFHVSLRLDYPNDFDRRMAALEGRTDLGGDIMIHGGAASTGCLAVGDAFAEEVFVLAADTGLDNVRVILAPADLRNAHLTAYASTRSDSPDWVTQLYTEIRRELRRLPPRRR